MRKDRIDLIIAYPPLTAQPVVYGGYSHIAAVVHGPSQPAGRGGLESPLFAPGKLRQNRLAESNMIFFILHPKSLQRHKQTRHSTLLPPTRQPPAPAQLFAEREK